jgi:tetratricopeptide (TPR) repeat protein
VRRDLLICLLLAVVTLAVYAPVRHHGFITVDDPAYVSQNPAVRQGLTAESVRWALGFHESNWHPLTWLSHMLDTELFGEGRPGGPHVVNVLLHTASALVLYLLLRRTTGLHGPSALVAFLFALHPLHVESVAWISERKDCLSTLLLMLTLGCYSRYALSTRGRSWYVATLACFALGLAAKPMLVTVPCLLLLLDHWPLDRLRLAARDLSSVRPGARATTARALVVEKLPFFALSFGSSVVTFLAQYHGGSVSKGLSLPWRLGNAVISYGAYLIHTFVPTRLAVFYPLRAREEFPVLLAILAAALLLALTAAALRLWRRQPWFLVGWSWYLGTLVPVIGIVQVGEQAMADRYTYVPLVGIFIALAFALEQLLRRRSAPRGLYPAVSALVLVPCLILTRQQLGYWSTSLDLFGRALAVTSRNDYAHANYALALAQANRPREALEHYERALAINPSCRLAYVNYGDLLRVLGRPDAALEHNLEVLARVPDDPDVLNNVGVIYLDGGDPERAREYFERAGRAPWHDFRPHANLGLIALDQGEFTVAVERFEHAVRMDPFQPALHQYLAVAHAGTGQFPRAVAAARRARDLARAAADSSADPARRAEMQSLLAEISRQIALYEAGRAD